MKGRPMRWAPSIRSPFGPQGRAVTVAPVFFESLERRVCLSALVGAETLINSTTVGTQDAAAPLAVATASNGDFVGVWESLGQDALGTWGVYARRYTAAGSPKGPEFLVNSGTVADDQRRPSVACDAAGNFVVVWDGAGPAGLLPSIYAQRYDASGAAQGGLITVAIGTLVQPKTNAAIAMKASGDFLVVWESMSQDALLTSGVYGRVYAANGTALTSEFLVNQTTAGDQVSAVGAPDAAGNFVIAWSGQGTGDVDGVFVRRFSAAGAAITGELRVNTTTAGAQAAPALAISLTGDVLVAWQGAGPGDGAGVFAQRYDASLTPVGGETAINDQTAGTQAGPAISFDDDGDFVVAWSGQGTGDVDGVYAREFAVGGTARGASSLVNTTAAGAQSGVSIASRADNAYVLTWSGAGAADADGVFARLMANEPPVVATTPTVLPYPETSGPLAIDPGLTVTDDDNATLTGATIAISGNYAAGEDVLAFVSQSGITGVWDAGTGVLTLSGTATLAAYQAALRSVTYANSSSNPSTLGRTIAFVANDGSDSSAPATRLIDVGAVNDLPVVVTTGGTLTYTEGDGAVAIDPGLTVSDVDSPTLAGATVSISGNYAPGQDLLSFTSQSGISGSWDAASGVLTLVGVATIAAYQAALRSVTYTNTSNTPSTPARTVSVVVSDGAASSAPATRTINVVAVNDPPLVVTSGGPLSYTENSGAVPVDPGLAVSDVDSASLTGATVVIAGNYAPGQDVLAFVDQLGIVGSWDAATGTLTLSGVATLAAYQTALRSVTYANASDTPSALARTITFIVNDGTDASAGATRNVNVIPVNDTPVVVTTGSVLFYAPLSGAVAVDPGLAVSDADSPTLAGAAVTISGNYTLGQDVLGFVNQSGIVGVWNVLTGTLTLSGAATAAAYQAALRSVTYTNTSPIPSTLARTVSFVVDDGTASSAPATRTIDVGGVNIPPVVLTSLGALLYTENTGAVAIDPGVTVTDLDDATLVGATISISVNYTAGEDALSFTSQSGIVGSWDAATGILTLSGIASLAAYQAALRSVTYANTSENPSVLARTVSFVVNDGTNASLPGVRAVAVVAVNDAPVVTTTIAPLSYIENSGAVPIDPGLTVGDVDSLLLVGATITVSGNYAQGQDQLAFTTQSGIIGVWDAATGTLTLIGVASASAYQAALRTVTYTNTSDNPSTLTRTVMFVVNDGLNTSAPTSRDIDLVAVNDRPVLAAGGLPVIYVENSAPVQVASLLTVVDADSAQLMSAVISISGNYASGQDVLGFNDQNGIAGSWDTVTGTLTLSGAASVAAYQAALRSITYVNTSDGPSALPRTVSFVVSDGAAQSVPGTRTITVVGVNDPPVVTTTPGAVTFVENGSPVLVDPGLGVADGDSLLLAGATVTINGNYAQGQDLLSFTNQSGISGIWDAAAGRLTLIGVASVNAYRAALRSITYGNTSDNPSTLTRTVTFVVSDGLDASAPGSRNVGVVAVNDAPVVNIGGPPALYIENSTPAPIAPLLTAADADSLVLTGATVSILGNYAPGQDVLVFTDQNGIVGSWNALAGILTLSGTASVGAYQAALRSVAYFNTSDHPSALPRTVVFIVSDGTDPSAPAAQTVNVLAANDPPVVFTSLGTASFVENGSPQPVDPALVISDTDSVLLNGAMITIGNYVQGQDVLLFVDQSGISGAWDAATGTLTLSGLATLAEYQAAMRSVSYSNASDAPSPVARVVSFVVSDGSGASAPAARDVDIVPVNDLPEVVTNGGGLSWTENSAPSTLAPSLDILDPDSTLLAGAAVAIVGNYLPGQDTLAFTDQRGIVGSWDASTGVLTLVGLATLSDYAAALRSVEYSNTSDDPGRAVRTVAFQVTDSLGGLGAAALLPLDILPVDDPPVLTVSPITLDYSRDDGAVAIDPELTVTDADNRTLVGAAVAIAANYTPGEDQLLFDDQLGITGIWDASAGVLTLSGAASVSAYQAALRSVRFRMSADGVSADPRSVTVSVDDGSAVVSAGRLIGVSIPLPPIVPPPPIAPPPILPPPPPPVLPPILPPIVPPPILPPIVPPVLPPPVVPPVLPPPVVPPVAPPPVAPPVSPPPVVPPPSAPPAVAPVDARPVLTAEHVDAPGLAALAGTTVALVNPAPAGTALSELASLPGVRALLTTAMVEVGGSLGAAYILWLIINYSLARYSLLLLPSFDPLDIHCLLSLARRERRLAA